MEFIFFFFFFFIISFFLILPAVQRAERTRYTKKNNITDKYNIYLLSKLCLIIHSLRRNSNIIRALLPALLSNS
ncbi:hypothetical protein ASPTUDRAFT_606633 [Aspergillus tubingensis CBS 134.48]|uniref:Secreted protein n=1 Tax=Aspergillus tubingensis (strain CBS 134.48) TaxID=767770 RepID=A0A1L9N2E3_ASPTC|nr:hypothetical protein ASPTUDRAFT_606633 [Aspergillus tubingensis CBS 134.48]